MADDPMGEIRASFFVECEELLESLQDGLLALDNRDADAETINICFRAVHSIKGGAGAFGLDDLVRCAHRFESALDGVRKGTIEADGAALPLFFSAADTLSDIVQASRDLSEPDRDAMERTLSALEALAGNATEIDDEISPSEFQPMGLSLDLTDVEGSPDPVGSAASENDASRAESGMRRYLICFVPAPELFQSGNEPLHLIDALSSLGKMAVETDVAAVPPLHRHDPERAYLRWTIQLDTESPPADIDEVFDFVDGLCDLSIESNPPLETGAELGRAVSALPPDHSSDRPAFFGEPQVGTGRPKGATRITLSEPTSAAPATQIPVPSMERSADSAATAPPESVPPTPSTARNTGTTVRVDLDRIDRLVNLVGELVINQAMLSQSITDAGLHPDPAIAQGLEESMHLTRDIQDSVMMIRAQPVKPLFRRMSRIVRESATALGKRVRLVTSGETTEIDRTVIERLADPLTHMIRNAVDHGIENGADRVAAGKPEEGTVSLTAAHRSGRVIIEIADDGAGIDRPRIRQIAEAKGLIPKGMTLSEAETDALLFLPGFSTATSVSELSGRGVGMDVVRSAIQRLGGRITIASTPGQGTTISISLPLTLAVLDGMVVKAAGESLVVPLGAISETHFLQGADLRRLGPQSHVLHIHDSLVPLLDLGVELGFRDPPESYEGHVVLLVTQEDGTRAALIVDSLEDQRQVVIKGLQDSYGQVPGIAAVTILGDGRVALILDPIDLMARATGCTRSRRLAG